MARSSNRDYHVWTALSLGFILLFLWSFPLLPATDLPQHLGISSILWRLVAGDPAVSSYYVFNPQPTPYYLAYALLTPCVGLFGAITGARIALSILQGAFRLDQRFQGF